MSFLGQKEIHYTYVETRVYCEPNWKENIHIKVPQTGIFFQL